ncbi:4241_t:CDS:2, partial [Diversispora eburnea]
TIFLQSKNINMVKCTRMRSDAVPLSSEDYKFIMQYRDAKPKTKVLKELRKKYPMTYDRFYRIWRGQEVGMVEWYQLVSDPVAPQNQDLSIPESYLPDINQASMVENSNGQTSVFETYQINKDILCVRDTAPLGGKDDMYTIIEREAREAEEAEC